jgi:hypothetical protein
LGFTFWKSWKHMIVIYHFLPIKNMVTIGVVGQVLDIMDAFWHQGKCMRISQISIKMDSKF